MISIHKISGFTHYKKFQTSTIEKLVWPYSYDDDLVRWRAMILFSILFGGLILGTIAFAGALTAIAKEGVWSIAIADVIGLVLGFSLLRVPKIKFEIRASLTCLLFFFIGVIVIISIGPQIGGPEWLFAFSVLSGVLMGNIAALAAIILNAFFLITICLLVLNGNLDYNMPFFSSPKDMVASITNFIVTNGITAISVTTLVKGIFNVYYEKEQLAKNLQKEQKDLLLIKKSLETEIGERKRAEADLQLKNLVFESAITANSASNAESLLNSVNNTFLRLWGYERKEEVLGKYIVQFFKFEHEAKTIITSLDETGVWEGEFTALRKDGSTFVAYALATTIHSPSEGIAGYQSSIIDISDRKKAESDKIEAQKIAAENEKLALVGQIAGKMAHDFNNILGIIMGVSEISMLDCKDEKTNENLELILNQTIRGRNLTKTLVAFAESQEPKQEFFKINEKIDLVLNLMKKELENIEIQVDHGLDIPDMLADSGMIENALINFFQNSIHATSKTKDPRIFISTYCLDKNIYFEIEDNGCGIPEEYLEKIYEPSFTLKGGKDVKRAYKKGIKGTGYGMSNIKKYIGQHNGKIWVESVVDSGTKFTISLPVVKKDLTSEKKIEIQKRTTHFEKSILLVEDEKAIADVQYRILTQDPCNHNVDTANNGKIAMDLFDRNEYDFVSLDYILSGNINGMDVYHHIRKKNKAVPILFVSGNIEFLESIKELKQKDTRIDHLSKPCRNIDYLNCINNLFLRAI